MNTYQIVRFYADPNKRRRVVDSGLTLEEVKEHCNDPKTSGEGWFDGYTKEE